MNKPSSPYEVSTLLRIDKEMNAFWGHTIQPIVGVQKLSQPENRMLDRLIGTGTLVTFGNQPLLVTVAHVANKAEKFSVVLFGNENGIGCVNILTNKGAPDRRLPPLRLGIPNEESEESVKKDPDAKKADVAIMAVDTSQIGIIKGPIPAFIAAIAKQSPKSKEGDVYWFAGFPGAKEHFSAFGNQLGMDRHITFESQLQPSFSWFDDEIHFCIRHEPIGKNAEGEDVHRVLPYGLSGSTIWKTNFLETGDSAWSPDKARVVALATRWDVKTSTIIGTRIEVVNRSFQYVSGWLSGTLSGGYKPPRSN